MDYGEGKDPSLVHFLLLISIGFLAGVLAAVVGDFWPFLVLFGLLVLAIALRTQRSDRSLTFTVVFGLLMIATVLVLAVEADPTIPVLERLLSSRAYGPAVALGFLYLGLAIALSFQPLLLASTNARNWTYAFLVSFVAVNTVVWVAFVIDTNVLPLLAGSISFSLPSMVRSLWSLFAGLSVVRLLTSMLLMVVVVGRALVEARNLPIGVAPLRVPRFPPTRDVRGLYVVVVAVGRALNPLVALLEFLYNFLARIVYFSYRNFAPCLLRVLADVFAVFINGMAVLIRRWLYPVLLVLLAAVFTLVSAAGFFRYALESGGWWLPLLAVTAGVLAVFLTSLTMNWNRVTDWRRFSQHFSEVASVDVAYVVLSAVLLSVLLAKAGPYVLDSQPYRIGLYTVLIGAPVLAAVLWRFGKTVLSRHGGD